MLFYFESKGLDKNPNIMALYSTHKNSALLHTSSEVNGIQTVQANYQDLGDKFATTVYTFPILFTYKGAGIWLFSASGFRFFFFFIQSFLCLFTSFLPTPTNPRQSVVIVQGREEGVFSDKIRRSVAFFLVSSARVSLSCLIKQGLIPPSVCPIPKVPKCSSFHSPEEKTKQNTTH